MHILKKRYHFQQLSNSHYIAMFARIHESIYYCNKLEDGVINFSGVSNPPEYNAPISGTTYLQHLDGR